MKFACAVVGAMLVSTAAEAGDLRILCPDRPGLDTPACTIDPGHVQIETGIADWTREKDPESVTDTLVTGDWLVRAGVGRSTELRFGWTSYGRERERDRMSGDVQTSHRTGDITLGIKQNIAQPDGEGFSVAVLPSVTLPVGRSPIGAGTWSASMLIPVSWEIGHHIYLQLTPEVNAAADQSGAGRHLSYGSSGGIDIALNKKLDLELEVQAIRDRDPSGHATMALASAALGYQIGKNWEVDFGGVAGLNHASPDVEAYCGIVRRF